MARIASLVGKSVTGDLVSLGMATGEGINDLLAMYKSLRGGTGLLKRGKSDIQLTEVRLLANNTAGGELKGPLKFNV